MNTHYRRFPRGLSALSQRDWQDRLARLVTFPAGKNILAHVVVDGKIDGKVPVEQVIERAKAVGLNVVQTDGVLYITGQAKAA